MVRCNCSDSFFYFLFLLCLEKVSFLLVASLFGPQHATAFRGAFLFGPKKAVGQNLICALGMITPFDCCLFRRLSGCSPGYRGFDP